MKQPVSRQKEQKSSIKRDKVTRGDISGTYWKESCARSFPDKHKQIWFSPLLVERGPECGDMLQQMASCLLFLLYSSCSSATCGGGNTFSDSARPPPNPGCRSFITRGTGHLQLKFICFCLELTLAFCTSLPVRRNESESHSDTDGSLSVSKLSVRSI